MSRTIDERIVEMRFDNAQFEKNVATSMSTLDKLKKSLNFKNSSKSLEEIGRAANRVRFDGMIDGINTVNARFSYLQGTIQHQLNNIVDSCVMASKRMASALTTQPIKDGFAEYETQMNAVQTILANTQKEGTNVKMVNAALDELNRYADKTIYNFTEMTRNIGTFTAAGVKLDTSVSAIQGIANLAAVSGSTSQQASTAMYQLSQALAAGTVKLMDWNSVVNAGMGGQVFQDALIRTSEHLKTGAQAAIDAKGSFRESLQTGWLTTEVLTQTLDQFATAADTQEEYEAAVKKFLDQGYSEEQAKQMADMAKTAGAAATKVKTFSQLIDTLKESLGSGWTETWRTVIGDFEEAKELWTSVSDVLSDAINKSSDARNAIVKEWADLGGRTALIDSFRNAFNALLSIITPIKEAFSYVFPPSTAQQLLAITEGIRDLTAKMKLSDSIAAKLEKTFEGLFSIASIGIKVIGGIGKAFFQLLTSSGVSNLAEHVLSIGEAIGDALSRLNDSFKMDDIANGLGTVVGIISAALNGLLDLLDSVFGAVNNKFRIDGLLNVLASMKDGISNVFDYISDKFKNISSAFTKIKDVISSVISTISGYVKQFVDWVKENFTLGDLFAGLIGGGIFVTIKKIIDLIQTIKDKIEGLFGKTENSKLGQIVESFKGALDSLHDSLEAFTTGIKATALLEIALAISLLAGSMDKISNLSVEDIGKSLASIASLFAMLNLSFRSMNKTLSKYDTKGVIKAAGSMVIMSAALNILANAMVKMSGLSWNEIAKGLVGTGTGLFTLCVGLKGISDVKISASTSIALLALAKSCEMLGNAMTTFATLSWSEIARGLVGMGAALKIFTSIINQLGKSSGVNSILSSASMLIAVQSLDKLASGLAKFGDMNWDGIARGLVGMGGALTELTVSLTAIGKLAGFSSIFGAGAILIVTQGLDTIAETLKKFGFMSWDVIKKGLTGMGVALGEIATVVTAVGKLAGFSSIFGAGAILIVISGLDAMVNAFMKFAFMSWDDIAKGLAGMGEALGELGLISGLIGKLAGFSGIIGAGTILLTVQGLSDIADAMKQIGSISWDGIARGLTGMGVALSEIAAVSGLLGKLTGFSGLLGATTILIAVQSLMDIADALNKIGIMGWENIAQGLVGLGGALTELSVISGLLGKLAGISGLLGAATILVAVQSLDDLAEALKKFGSMTWDETAKGLTGMGEALGELGLISGLIGTLCGGAGLLGAATILIAVQSLDDLATALQKFGSMSWDEISNGLAAMGAALGELALGGLANTFSILGSLSIAAVAEPLGVLADSVKKWKDVTIPEGLSNQLSSLASGIMSFTFGGLGASALSESAPAIGTMADSIRKWSGVTIPEGLEDGLTQIANGVKAFTWAFVGGLSIDTITGPLGKLPDSIKKWNDVTVPGNIDSDLKKISDGIKSFSVAFVGGWTLDAIVGPIGDLAKSIKKWNDVEVPKDLESGLQSIAKGIKSFGTAFVGGWSLDSVTEPIGNLALSVKKWKDVTVPETIEEQLSKLANGVRSFEGIQDISYVVSSIESISTSMKQLNDVQFETVSAGLSVLASSLLSFSSNVSSVNGLGDVIVSNLITPIQNAQTVLPTAVSSLVNSATGILMNSGGQFAIAGQQAADNFVNAFTTAGPTISTAMTTVMTTMSGTVLSQSYVIEQAFNTMMTSVVAAITSRQSYFATAGSTMMLGMSVGVNSGSGGVISAVSSVMTRIASATNVKVSTFITTGRQITTNLRTGVMSGAPSLLSQITTIITNAKTKITSRGTEFMAAGISLMNSLSGGIYNGASRVTSALGSALSNCGSKIRSYYYSFQTAGQYLGSGLVSGINSKQAAAYRAGYNLGRKAVEGEKAGQQSHSPSKATRKAGRWLGEGLVIGMKEMASSVYQAGKSMGNKASNSITEALTLVNDIATWGIDADPEITIHPVLDMSDINSGIGYIDGLLNTNKTIGLSTSGIAPINTADVANQNGFNTDVIKAIDSLRKDIGTTNVNTYNLNGITYDDGSNVADAIQTLVRAANIERRR
ncbi:MAG: tape measure protein [Mediterraneibacter faecis]